MLVCAHKERQALHYLGKERQIGCSGCTECHSPADTQVDLEVGFKLFFFTDSCSPDLAGQESD